MKLRHCLVRIGSLIVLGCASVSLWAMDKPIIRVGINLHDAWRESQALIVSTQQALKSQLPEYQIEFREMDPQPLREAVSYGQLDIVLASSSVYRQVAWRGARDLATMVTPDAKDPNLGEGSLVLVQSDRLDITSLDDLRGKRIAYSKDFGFSGLALVIAEMDKEGDFQTASRAMALQAMPPNVETLLATVQDRQVDALILPACLLEDVLKTQSIETDTLRVLNPKWHASMRCLHSTNLYPNLTVFTLPSTSPDVSRLVTQTLLSMPEVAGMRWAVATDFSATDRMLRKLNLDAFAHLREWSWSRLWKDYWPWLLMLIFLVFGLMAHSLRARILVKQKTKELREALTREVALKEESKRAASRIERLQKMGVVGQMSSLFAHEVRQPLNAIICYAYTLAKHPPSSEGLVAGLKAIEEEAQRADGIVKRVRGYLKTTQPHKVMSLSQTAEHALKEFLSTAQSSVPIKTMIEPEVTIVGDPLEMELVMINLLRNAQEAMEKVRVPSPNNREREVIFKIYAGEGRAHIEVADYGEPLSAEAWQRLTEPNESTKPEGLGLGLSIVRTLLESHQGDIQFVPNDPQGLVVRVSLPQAPAHSDLMTDSSHSK